MNIKINYIDTFNLIKGILSIVKDTNSAACHDDLDDVLNQMNIVPVTDNCGYFIEEEVSEPDPRTPVEKMQEKFCSIFDEANLGFTARDMCERHGDGDDPVPGYFDAWDNFLNSIGCAPILVAYAGVKLRRMFEAAGQDYSWIDKCVDYYEENWEAE